MISHEVAIPLTSTSPNLYPRTIQEFEERLSTEDGCRAKAVAYLHRRLARLG